jgi:hypothetical protein
MTIINDYRFSSVCFFNNAVYEVNSAYPRPNFSKMSVFTKINKSRYYAYYKPPKEYNN